MQRDAERPTPASELASTLTDPAFLAALCHDLRGPLGAIGTWVHVLRSGRADATRQQQALAAMERDVASQSRLIEQVADLSSILAGTLRPSVEEVDLLSLLGSLGARLDTTGSAPKVLADPRRLRQILAILFFEGAATGSPAPTLVAGPEGPGAFSIRGLARREGPGLVALTLARALAELQGGRLTTSTAAEGTAFTIRLRVPDSAEPKG